MRKNQENKKFPEIPLKYKKNAKLFNKGITLKC